MRQAQLVAFALVSLTSIQCSSLPPICEPERARAAGRSQALQGKEIDLTVGQVCQGEHDSTFRTQYQAGYRDSLATYCSAETVAKSPYSLGENGTRTEFSESAYRVCDNVTELRAAFQRANREGLAAFCTSSNAAEAGRIQGDAGRAPQFDEAKYAVCDKSLPLVKIAYLEAQAAGLARFCRADGVETLGEKAGREGKPKAGVSERYVACSLEQKNAAVASYDAGYERGLGTYCEAENLRSSAQAQARTLNQPRFPEEFRVCLPQFPELATKFEIQFRDARQLHVESECTFERGQAQGTHDAETGNRKRTDLPLFCNASLFPIYLSGYLEGWKTNKDRLCSASDAYDHGMRDARFGYRLDYQAPTLCPNEYQAPLFQKYREGYHFAQLQKAGVPNSFNADYSAPTYPVQRAQEACLRKGFAPHQCEDVTSIACLEMGHSPFQCDLQSDFMVAVDSCLRRGHSPLQCEDVKNRACIESGKAPLLCGEKETRVAAP